MIQDTIVTRGKLDEFENLIKQNYVARYDFQRILDGYASKYYLRDYLHSNYVSRGLFGREMLNYAKKPEDLAPYATIEWVKEAFGPYVEPGKYATLEYVDGRLGTLVEDKSLATREWSRGLLDAFERDWDAYATKTWVHAAIDESAHDHHEGLATESYVTETLTKRLAEIGVDDMATREWVRGFMDNYTNEGLASKSWVQTQMREAFDIASVEEIEALFEGE